ncbi:uncharacterized protein P884DRAFT_243130 [Thermothelomyces heterothallicus CBS 202.75]|uniref:uncharacterized protein n=1 Tax=Thermothelomyces heterothallicus CBS 202.75 TaxID=1149848 RepID=UPI003742C652
MLSYLATLLLLPLSAFAADVTNTGTGTGTPGLARREVSPDNTCGGETGYTCPGELACCSQHGYCGSTDEFCLTTAGCQAEFSNSTDACHEPIPGESFSIDGTCGTEGAGAEGYRCPANATVSSCCSAAGYCGTTEDHCDTAKGCQSEYGNCTTSDEERRGFIVRLF